jgi:uncharacterized protein (TIGR02217 family)
MSWALVSARAPHQMADHIHRFDPRFWTVNFPRPMLASVVASAPDALRVEAAFQRREDLCGLIWDAEDRWDHPLLSYETARDFRRCQLQFRWRSAGLKPLDAVYGPTLTIEGRDAAGSARAWYVRLWNYAEGTPEDAVVTLDFGALDGGFLLPGEADPVYAGDVDRLFVSLVAPDYDGSGGVRPLAAEGWVEISAIRCTGSGAVLAIGDVHMPEHGLGLSTGYDDQYQLTPQRVVRMIDALGYRGDIIHYVGMSHYPRLQRVGDAVLAESNGGALAGPCAAWHRAFAAEVKAAGMNIIWSLSYELFNAYCPEDWKQRSSDGAPALTGWMPPSTLLSPAHGGAMEYLRSVAAAFVTIAAEAGLPVKFQVGEPWWWTNSGGRFCCYDAATVAALGPLSVPMADIAGPKSAAQIAMLDALGALLATSTAALVVAARAAAGPSGLTSHVLVFLPTVLDAAAHEARRANVPLGWAAPAFDVLQLEDYDWLTSARGAETGPATAAMTARLGYPLNAQHYLAGFVLNGADRARWRPIMEAAQDAGKRGVAQRFVWALPQVARDGLVIAADDAEEEMLDFDAVDFPLAIGREAEVVTEFSTQVISAPSGHEQRISEWSDARMRYDVGPGVRSEAELVVLTEFFRARRGAARGFRFRDPLDHSSTPGNSAPGANDQPLGTGDGVRRDFPLVKHYGPVGDGQVRRITQPVAGSLVAAVGGALVHAFALLDDGIILFDAPPSAGAAVSAGFLFDVPVRFAEDRLTIGHATFRAGEVPSVPLVEVRR